MRKSFYFTLLHIIICLPVCDVVKLNQKNPRENASKILGNLAQV